MNFEESLEELFEEISDYITTFLEERYPDEMVEELYQKATKLVGDFFS